MKFFTKAFLAVCIILFNLTAAYAANTPAEIVQGYCKLDYEGVRLSSHTYPAVRSLVTWENEGGWDQATVIKKFEVGAAKVEKNRAEVIVNYYILGILDGNTLIEQQEIKTVIFKLENTGRGWKITEPIIEPHVSQDALEVLK